MTEDEIKYPAAVRVHTPSGPTDACIPHAEQVMRLFKYMGAHVVAEPLRGDTECQNCLRSGPPETEETPSLQGETG